MSDTENGGEKKAVVLLSGGLDSSTVAAIAQDAGYSIYALTVNYNQRHVLEIDSARKVAESIGVARHWVMPLDLRMFGGSALTDDIDVPMGRDLAEMDREIPVTYVPARNTVFLSLALACAESIGSADIFIGVNAVDYSGYPDCRPEFIRSFEQTANLATKAGVEKTCRFTIHTPLIDLTKSQIVELGVRLGVDYSQTLTCYAPTPDGLSCGQCDSCLLRLKGFRDAGLDDPAPYVE